MPELKTENYWVAAPGTAGVSQRVTSDRVEESEPVVLDVLVQQKNTVCIQTEY
jgi:hypothetical protein